MIWDPFSNCFLDINSFACKFCLLRLEYPLPAVFQQHLHSSGQYLKVIPLARSS